MNLLEIVAIRDKLKRELAVVEEFLEIAKAHGANGRNDSGTETPPVNPDQQRNLPLQGADKDYGTISNAVREAIGLAPEKYSVKHLADILTKINKPLSRVQIAGALVRFAKRDEIAIAQRGKGTKPTTYRKKPATNHPPTN